MKNCLGGKLQRTKLVVRRYERLERGLRSLTGDRRGASLIVFGLSLPILIGFLGLSVEVAYWYLEKRALQEAADSAALAAAFEKIHDDTAVQARFDLAASIAVDQSGFANPTQIIVNNPPVDGFFIADDSAFETYVTETYGTHFVSLFGMPTVDIQTRAVAKLDGGGGSTTACILSLHDCFPNPNEGPGIVLQGSLNLDAPGCSLHSNDTCQGIDIPGNPTINAECITAEGGGLLDSGLSLEESSKNMDLSAACGIPQLLFNGPKDPYCPTGIITDSTCVHTNKLVLPAPAGGCTDTTHPLIPNGAGNGNDVLDVNGAVVERTFSPGYYCAANPIQILSTGQNFFEPGMYYIESDILINGGTGALVCNGPCIVAQPGQYTFDFRGNGSLVIEAPEPFDISANNSTDPSADPTTDTVGPPPPDGTSGSDSISDVAFGLLPDSQAAVWAGIVLYNGGTANLGEPNNCANKLNGNGIMDIFGSVYYPGTCITFTGNANTDVSQCFQIIAGNVTLSGNFDLGVSGCPDTFPDATYPPVVGLVE